jgi:Lhr-like helicase
MDICKRNEEHIAAKYIIPDLKDAKADIAITTCDTLHRRLMDANGETAIWKHIFQPRIIVVDEVHLYEGIHGSHVANLMRRVQRRIKKHKKREDNQTPIMVAASATVGKPLELASKIFGISIDKILNITPDPDEEKPAGLEYLIFIKTPRTRIVSLDDNKKEENESDFRIVTEQATMIQSAFCLFHTMRKRKNKDRLLGFVDSLDVVKRLSQNIASAEGIKEDEINNEKIENPLYAFRCPSGRPENSIPDKIREQNPFCPKFRKRNCVIPPHHILEPCPIYEAGECWWLLGTPREKSFAPMNIQVHKSQLRAFPITGKKVRNDQMDDWNTLIATSSLEVGFDHPNLISTFQYGATSTVAGFRQRLGRGGRGIDDIPIMLVVFGNRTGDIFYFHHHHHLSDPKEEDLVVYFDVDNPFIKKKHQISALLDFIASQGDTGKFYRDSEMKKLADILNVNKQEVIGWLMTVFNIEDSYKAEALFDEGISIFNRLGVEVRVN